MLMMAAKPGRNHEPDDAVDEHCVIYSRYRSDCHRVCIDGFAWFLSALHDDTLQVYPKPYTLHPKPKSHALSPSLCVVYTTL